jgi:transcriptional regulator with XRE-family HTH domain
MNKYFFTEQISKKFGSINDLPDWLSSYPPEIKEQIKLIRETLGMTQGQLAKRVNRSLRSIQQIESGQAMPKISTLKRIADALNAELQLSLIPRKNILEYIEEKAIQKAKQLVMLSEQSSALEAQSPSEEEIENQVENLKRNILETKRKILWNQNQSKK